MNNLIILPNDPDFNLTLAQLKRPDWRAIARKENWISFVCDADSGLLRPVSESELEDYLEGGEYEEVVGSEGMDDCYGMD